MSDAFLCGGLAGAVGSFATQPLDTIRIKMQTMAMGSEAAHRPTALPARGTPGTIACLGAVLRREGALGLYKGVLAPVAAAGPRSACIFAGYDTALRLRGGPGSLADHALAGAAGGVLAAPVTNSMELVKCRAQVSKACSSSSVASVELQICSRLLRSEGLRGLTCGLPLTMARDGLFRGIFFGAYEASARTIEGGKRPGGHRPLSTSLLAGGLAGMAAWLPVYPVDVIKTHWQTGRRFNATTVLGLLRNGLVAEGPQWLARGLGPTLVRAWPLNAIVCTIYERLQVLLH